MAKYLGKRLLLLSRTWIKPIHDDIIIINAYFLVLSLIVNHKFQRVLDKWTGCKFYSKI